MKNILAIGASNSKKSINKVLANHIANKIENSNITVLDWEEMVLPLYNPDWEEEAGVPENAKNFLKLISNADAVVLSLAEHNGLPTSAFKNLWDWTSRVEQKFWANKPMFLAATSPGGRGGASVLKVITDILPHFGGNVITSFSLPAFYDNLKDGKITNEELNKELENKIELFEENLLSLD